MASVTEHLKTPQIGIDAHARRSQIALGQSLASKKAIYLDMRYWILLRKAAAGTGSQDTHELLRLLRKGVVGQRLFCPIGESVFIELMKQSDQASRKATAILIDELGGGVTLIAPEQRTATEIACFLYQHSGIADLHPLEHLVWTKLTYVLGTMHPAGTAFDPATELAIQKAFFDHMWDISLSEIIDVIGDQPLPTDTLGAASDALNKGIAENAHMLRSFQQAYSAEIRGVVDVTCDAIPDIMLAIAQAQGVSLNKPTESERANGLAMFKNLIAAALERGKGREQLRAMHIYASLHASLRWNKGRKLDANDLYDFQHAVAALGYADVFLTENPLRVMITQRHLGLDSFYGCTVVSDVADAVAVVAGLVEDKT